MKKPLAPNYYDNENNFKTKSYHEDIAKYLIFIEKRNAKMFQTLKQVRSDINIVGEVSHATLEKIISIINELKS